MNQIKYYYQINLPAFDCLNQEDILDKTTELNSFDDLIKPLNTLKTIYETKSEEKSQINVCVLLKDALYFDNVIQLSVVHVIKKKFLSKKIKDNFYSIFAFIVYDNETISNNEFYHYDTHDFNDVYNIFNDYITKQKSPDLSKWSYLDI